MKTSVNELLRFYKQVKKHLKKDTIGNFFYQHNKERLYCNVYVFIYALTPEYILCCPLGLWAKLNNYSLPNVCTEYTVSELLNLNQDLVYDLFFNFPKGHKNDFMFHLDLIINKLTKAKEQKMSKQPIIKTGYRIYINDAQHLEINGKSQWLRRSDARLVVNNWLRKLYKERIQLKDTQTLFIETEKNSLTLYEVDGILYFVLKRGQVCYSTPNSGQWQFVWYMENMFTVKP